MPRKYFKWERPFDPTYYKWDELVYGRERTVFGPRPMTEMEVLMREAPGFYSDSPVALEETAALKELLGAAVDSLTPEDRYIMETLLIEKRSLRKTGAVLGIPKTTLARRRDKSREYLMKRLAGEEVVQDWLKRFH